MGRDTCSGYLPPLAKSSTSKGKGWMGSTLWGHTVSHTGYGLGNGYGKGGELKTRC